MRYKFTEYILDTDKFELTRSGEEVRLEPQALELLVLLVRENGRVLPRDEINQEIWKGRVVSDAALSSRIKMLRKAVGDDGRCQHTIRTLSKKGFRFVADVETLDAGDEGSVLEPGHAAATEQDNPRFRDLSDSRPSVAVLPFVNLSGDTEQTYFSDGITEDIITALSKFRWFFVISRNSTFVYKGKAVDIKQVGRELGVRYVLEGSVRKSENRVRISAQLIETRTGIHVWAERFDRKLNEMFELQDEITSTIAAAVEPELAGSERHRAMRQPTENLGAWDYFHRGVAELWRQEHDSLVAGIQLIRKATTLDPGFGQAYGYLAFAGFSQLMYEWAEPAADVLRQGLEDAAKAVAIDQRDYFAFHVLGRLQTFAGRHRAALSALETSLEINPNFALGYVGLGEAHVYAGSPNKAIEFLDTAIQLSPNDPIKWDMYHYKASAYIRLDDFDRAIENFEKACEFPTAQYVPFATLAALYVIQGRAKEGAWALENSQRLEPKVTVNTMKKVYGVTEEKPGSRPQRLLDALRAAGMPEE